VLPVSPPPENLADALARHEIHLPPQQIAMLDRYRELLWEWNGKINLTRHTGFEKFVARDVVDSLAIAKYLQPNETVLDVGSGGGVPGVILSIVRDDLRVSMCESVAKRARVLADVVERLELRSPVVKSRAADPLTRPPFDRLVIRAVARLKKLLEWFQPHWKNIGRLLILKGPSWVDERGEARHHGLMHDLALRKLCSYPLPGTESESVLLQIWPKDRISEGDDDE
jgi:16S rRNA (guanine527-N7)-methyltransferase